jgi:hypothetical protein
MRGSSANFYPMFEGPAGPPSLIAYAEDAGSRFSSFWLPLQLDEPASAADAVI